MNHAETEGIQCGVNDCGCRGLLCFHFRREPSEGKGDTHAQGNDHKSVFGVASRLRGVIPLVEDFGYLAGKANCQGTERDNEGSTRSHRRNNTLAVRQRSIQTARYAAMRSPGRIEVRPYRSLR